MVILAVFLFAALVFGTYDYMVNRRQLNLMHTAKSTSALVATLTLPEKDMQKRILDEAGEQAEREHAQKEQKQERGIRRRLTWAVFSTQPATKVRWCES